MASLLLKNCLLNVQKSRPLILTRCVSATPVSLSPASPHTNEEDLPSETHEPKKKAVQGWLKRILNVRQIDPGSQSHSEMLTRSGEETVYELQIHRVHPMHMEAYLKRFEVFVDAMHNKKTGAQLAGSWTVEVGDQDEAVHLWKYEGGYAVLNNANKIYRQDQDFINFRLERNTMLRSRMNQIVLEFSFWPQLQQRSGPGIYELRSYVLKPGTMIEWGQAWSQGIKHRQREKEAVAGFFCQIGQLYTAHHLFTYDSLQKRREIREAAWRVPGWDDCVAYTVPLIREMQSRILIPTPFSPLQ